MELTPYSLAQNAVVVHFAGLEDTVAFCVAPAVAEKVVEALCFPTDDDGEPADEPAFWIKINLLDGSVALLSRDHISLVTHTFEWGAYVGVPPPGVYGRSVSDEVADAHEWGPVMVAVGIENVGVIDLYDQTSESTDTLADTVPEGFLFSPFVAFTDDDGETSVVATDRVCFVMLHADVL